MDVGSCGRTGETGDLEILANLDGDSERYAHF